MAKENTNTKETETIMLNAVIKSAFTHAKKDDAGKPTGKLINVIILYPDVESDPDVWEVLTKLYEHTADRWIPNWFKDKSGITLKSEYNIPIQIADENAVDLDEIKENSDKCIISFSDFVTRGYIEGARCFIQCNIRESAIYPKAVRIMCDGKEYDPFADF